MLAREGVRSVARAAFAGVLCGVGLGVRSGRRTCTGTSGTKRTTAQLSTAVPEREREACLLGLLLVNPREFGFKFCDAFGLFANQGFVVSKHLGNGLGPV